MNEKMKENLYMEKKRDFIGERKRTKKNEINVKTVRKT